jgi:Uma2 family endonuclease
MYDLSSELVGEWGLPDEFHRIQAELLSETCQLPELSVDDEVFTASNLNLYYDSHNYKQYKRPDWFLVLGAPRFTQQQQLRFHYVIWQEGVAPFLVVELLSPGTENEDLGQNLGEANQPPTKWQVYERLLRIPYYVVYDRDSKELRAFELRGTRYQPIDISSGRIWFKDIQLGLGLWEGDFQQVNGFWLRWYGANGWVPTLVEKVTSERDRANAEYLRAERLAEYLRSQGIDPDNLA